MPPGTDEMFQGILKLFKPESFTDSMITTNIIKAVNQCNEIRYIQLSGNAYSERRELLDILLMKCKKLLSFVLKREHNNEIFDDMMDLYNKVRLAKYKNDDITHLYEEFCLYEIKYKNKSQSSMNLSNLEI